MQDLICLSGQTYETRQYSGVVVHGRWYDWDDDLPTGVQDRVERTLDSDEVQDAPVSTIDTDDGADYYYYLYPWTQ